MVRKTTAVMALVAGLLLSGPASAGGGHLAPVLERYEPGQVATLVGYTGGPVLPALPDRQFYAYLRPSGGGAAARLLRTDIYVGELVVEETAHRGYLRFRVSVSFPVPDYLEPGDYDLVYCDDPCTGEFLGDLVGGQLSVGVDPARRVVRYWAPDEPEIANLAPDAILVGPGSSSTAAGLRAPAIPPDPAPATAPGTTVPLAAPVTRDEEMAWPLPTALVLAAAAGTGLVLTRRQRAGRARPGWAAVDARRPGAAPAGRG